MNAERIFERLAELAPSIRFECSREEDLDEVWDGDAPDPSEDGSIPYVVTVSASAIVGGKRIEGNARLGSCYYADDEPIGDVHGYLPQMLQDACDELFSLTDGLMTDGGLQFTESA